MTANEHQRPILFDTDHKLRLPECFVLPWLPPCRCLRRGSAVVYSNITALFKPVFVVCSFIGRRRTKSWPHFPSIQPGHYIIHTIHIKHTCKLCECCSSCLDRTRAHYNWLIMVSRQITPARAPAHHIEQLSLTMYTCQMSHQTQSTVCGRAIRPFQADVIDETKLPAFMFSSTQDQIGYRLFESTWANGGHAIAIDPIECHCGGGCHKNGCNNNAITASMTSIISTKQSRQRERSRQTSHAILLAEGLLFQTGLVEIRSACAGTMQPIAAISNLAIEHPEHCFIYELIWLDRNVQRHGD